jgi:hypothetical protein
MKKMNLKVVACLLVGTLMCSSCIGSFSLFNSYAKWQRTMTDNKFVNAIVGFVLMPICGSISILVDSLVLNSIEFWSGKNPMSADIGKTRQVLGSDGLLYAVTTLKNGYEIKSANGEVSHFYYNQKTDTWSYEQNGVKQDIFRYNTDGTLTVMMQDGQQCR